jgi:hypothetical protein
VGFLPLIGEGGVTPRGVRESKSIMLTRLQAKELILARLSSGAVSGEISVVECAGAEHAFGWVFQVTSGHAATSATLPRLVIVNKTSEQVVASRTEYEVEQFVRLYEKLLSQNQARSQGWCGTLPLSFPWSLWRKRTVAERAKDGGFYEIGGKEASHD